MMIVARGGFDGERIEVSKVIRRRLRDREILSDRDVLMAEWSLRGMIREDIAARFRCSHQNVTARINSIPDRITAAIAAMVKVHRDSIPTELRERIARGLAEYRQRNREERRDSKRSVA